ncbi:MAG: hypothetical protein AABZ34_13150 [Nitrospirota bacterium]
MTPYLKRGDIVVLPLEYEHYRATTPYSDWFTNQVMAWYPEYFWQLENTEKLRFLRSVLPQRVLLGVIAKLMEKHLDRVRSRERKSPSDILSLVHAAWNNPDHQPDKMFSFLNLNPHGDAIVSAPEHPLEYNGNPYKLDLDFVEPAYFWGALQDFFVDCQSRGVQVYIAWPPTLKDRLDLTSPRIQPSVRAIVNKVRKLGIPILGNPSDFQYDPDLFTGSIYHLTPRGRAEHTSRLLSYLMAEPPTRSHQPQ